MDGKRVDVEFRANEIRGRIIEAKPVDRYLMREDGEYDSLGRPILKPLDNFPDKLGCYM
ncbi:MAG: hypothetical protein HY517_00035 [Candidatus Aenigmarchaeota archaeon]|nr:hypothetical protein [Candidatus Aenigmarchaeota archaeon]